MKDDFSRYNLRFNLDHSLNKWINTGVQAQVTYSDQNVRKNAFSKANSITPLGTPYDENGDIVIYPVAGEGSTLSPLTDLRSNAAVDPLKKYLDPNRTSPEAQPGFNDILVIRLAEMYLIAVEAEFQLGDNNAAAEDRFVTLYFFSFETGSVILYLLL